MGTLYLVRHGQASFGAEDYDQLSELGQRQCEALGQTLGRRGLQPAAVLMGTLRRHQQSWQALARGLGVVDITPQAWPGLNEYDSLALLDAVGGEPLPPHDTPEGFKAHFRRLRLALMAWMEGRITPQGMPCYADFRAGVLQVLSHVQAQHLGQSVILVSSGGPISAVVSHVLGAPPNAAIDLNMRLRNSSLTELVVSPKRLELLAFNTLPHLEDEARRGWVSYA
ncbi:MAG: histidine phosphatase family protein [Betaproteobacteria bacterium]|nr:histidine phosphatase family protein [Betaproteobacteria bacterium]